MTLAQTDHAFKISRAKALLICDHPFFATLILDMDIVPCNEICETMATDGYSIFYNTNFVDFMNVQETMFVLAHEAMHSAFDHLTRRNHRDPDRWNQAADYIINDLLVTEKAFILFYQKRLKVRKMVRTGKMVADLQAQVSSMVTLTLPMARRLINY